MSKLTLVILAAGLGSRYGGLKQIEPVGTNKESIIDFSIYDAIAAGFEKVVLIIRPEHETAFEEALSHKIRPFVEVVYAYQELTDIPIDMEIDPKRNKPWGTTHAALVTQGVVDGPFTIINADDYYGKEAFVSMAKFLRKEVSKNMYSMIGYRLKNTTTEHGSVTRGVCKSVDGFLDQIVEIQKITKKGGKFNYENEQSQWVNIDGDELVSMNFWGFDPSVYPVLEKIFTRFLQEEVTNNPLQSEHVIPTAIGTALKEGTIKVKVIPSNDQWFGITYQEDREKVVYELKEMKKNGLYPFDLWAIK